ncbi:MAG: phosphoenolpyruvate--protein phosphotransferase [Candidatus Competibacter sp.]|nr:phosphoenolpyruvate--protein phosphotransferase [Candidatus Competibacter sp.]
MLITLRRIIQEVQTASDLDEALAIIVRRVKEAIPVDACAIYLIEGETDQYVLMAADGLNPSLIGQIRLDRSEGLVGWVGECQELINLQNATAHPRGGAFAETGEAGYHAFLGVPLIDYRQTLGVLVAWRQAEDLFDPQEAAFAVTLAARLAKVIHDDATIRKVTRLLDGEAPGSAFIQGIQGAPGVAIGTLALLDPLADLASIPDRPVPDRAAEEATFKAAVATVQEELRASGECLAADLPSEARALFEVYVMLLGSDSLMADTLQRIRAGNWAPGAWRDTIAERARVFDRMEDPYLRARAEDIRDIGRRVLISLQTEVKASIQYPQRCILVGEAVGITEIVAVPGDRLVGVVSQHGSALSHAAVLARALGIPAVVGLAALPIGRLDGREAVVDGDQARVYLQPSPAVMAAYQLRASEAEALAARLGALRDEPAETPDGVRVPLQVNAGFIAELAPALAHGAEGIGLFRTEFAFMARETFPVEDEQYLLYRTVLESFAPKSVTLRTLDVGGDKSLPYFPMVEDNPFLGCRGIRFTLDHPEIFLIQLRAMVRANAGLNNLRVLFPMIGRVDEVDEALRLLNRAYRELVTEGRAAAKPLVGAMIEVPSAVYLTAALAKRVDFLSVGTNDLTQYLLAVDRNNAAVATPYDSLHPAVLHAVRHVVEEAHRQGKPAGVCGEIAGDPAGVLLLLGMGADTLSMNPTRLARVKGTIRRFTAQQARALLEEALALEDGFAIHRLLVGALEEAGLGRRVPPP